MSYIIGLWFTLRTHAAVIWATEADEKKAQAQAAGAGASGTSFPDPRGSNGAIGHATLTRQSTSGTVNVNPRSSIRDSQLYKRILGQSLKQAGIAPKGTEGSRVGSVSAPQTPYLVPPKSSGDDGQRAEGGTGVQIAGLSAEENQTLVREVAEMAATAATVAARDAVRAPRKTSVSANTSGYFHRPAPQRSGTFTEFNEEAAAAEALGGGHDAPNWSRTKSSVILLGATILYAVIAEILVNTVDVVLESVDIDEKFLGITLFALVPNTTEFLNAISFAMNGNIALSMEIGSAYALQVCLLQIPALVLFSAVNGRLLQFDEDAINYTFP